MDSNIIEIITVAVFFISFYGLLTTTNIIKSIVFISIMETAVIMFFLGIGYRSGILPPIGLNIEPGTVADPLPQAFMITAVVIGLCGTAVNIVMFVTAFRKYGTANWNTAKDMNASDGSGGNFD